MMQKYFIRGFAVASALAAGVLLGQGPAAGPAFEVATIRPAPPIQDIIQQIQSGKARIGMSVDGARVEYGLPVIGGLDPHRVSRSSPTRCKVRTGWLSSDSRFRPRFPKECREDKVPEMLQVLLAERFKLAIHRDKKDLPVYALIVGKNGPS